MAKKSAGFSLLLEKAINIDGTTGILSRYTCVQTLSWIKGNMFCKKVDFQTGEYMVELMGTSLLRDKTKCDKVMNNIIASLKI